MCGIIGITGHKPVASALLDALKRLEYRGYDSAGIAVIQQHAETIKAPDSLAVRRCAGKVAALASLLDQNPIDGWIGIGHTRWGTHGRATDTNAHPHANHEIAVVHNGIIENFATLKNELIAQGFVFTSETDSEVILHLLERERRAGASPQEAVARTLPKLEGAFALAILFREYPEFLFGARRGSPLVVGYGDQSMYVGSDALALAGLAERIAFLHDDDWVVLTPNSAEIFDREGKLVMRPTQAIAADEHLVSKEGYDHFMLKEIFEQPATIQATLSHIAGPLPTGDTLARSFDAILADADLTKPIYIVACGTSYYAGMVAQYWIEQLARRTVIIDIASEFRYRQRPLAAGGLALFISQSGETADTLAALQLAKNHGLQCVAIVNVAESSLARNAHAALLTQAGREIGVASTKAFTAQLVILACLALAMAQNNSEVAEKASRLLDDLHDLPSLVQATLNGQAALASVVATLAQARSALFIGRDLMVPLALEGALKLKELSYIHAEGLPAGEAKHGPIALIDASVPVLILAPSTNPVAFEKTLSNMHEVMVRGAKVILVTDADGANTTQNLTIQRLVVPSTSIVTAPFVIGVIMQLIAYHTARHLERDVDQPRNLAKSVTVE